MKKILCAFLAILSLLFAVSCGDEEYPPVKSTDEELREVYTASYDGEDYEIPFELYRALFLTLKPVYDGGDSSIWSGDKSAEYTEKIDSEIKAKIASIYGTLHHAKKIGIDPYSDKFEEDISEYIKISVEGGVLGSLLVSGFDGDYDKYLESLREMNLNYSVQVLLYRYTLASAAIYGYYKGNIDSEDFAENVELGKLEYTKDSVKAFYDSQDCVRVLKAYLPTDYYTEERAKEIRNKIAMMDSEEAVANYIINYSTAPGTEVKAGELIGKNNLDRSYYAEYVDTAFSLSDFETSEVIKVNTGAESGYVIFYRTTKTDTHFEENYNMCTEIYIDNEIGKKLDKDADGILRALMATDYLEALDRSSIKMD